MSETKRKRCSAESGAEAALEAVRGEQAFVRAGHVIRTRIRA